MMLVGVGGVEVGVILGKMFGEFNFFVCFGLLVWGFVKFVCKMWRNGREIWMCLVWWDEVFINFIVFCLIVVWNMKYCCLFCYWFFFVNNEKYFFF